MCLALKLINLLFTKASSEMASMTHYPVRSGKHLIGRILIFQQDNVTKHTAIQQKRMDRKTHRGTLSVKFA